MIYQENGSDISSKDHHQKRSPHNVSEPEHHPQPAQALHQEPAQPSNNAKSKKFKLHIYYNQTEASLEQSNQASTLPPSSEPPASAEGLASEAGIAASTGGGRLAESAGGAEADGVG
jgi:hypothetical protein